MSKEERKSGWFALKAGAIGTIAIGFAGYLGHAAIQIASAPRDTVAYDFIQTATGLLKGGEAKPEPASEPVRMAAAPVAVPAPPPPMRPEIEPVPAPPKLSERAPAAPQPQKAQPAPAPTAPADGVARLDSALDKAARGARETGEMAARLTEKTMAMRGAKLVGVRHDEAASLCGGRYGVEVYPVSRAVVLKPDRSAAYVRLSVGQSKDLAPGCRVALKGTKTSDVAEADLEETGGT